MDAQEQDNGPRRSKRQAAIVQAPPPVPVARKNTPTVKAKESVPAAKKKATPPATKKASAPARKVSASTAKKAVPATQKPKVVKKGKTAVEAPAIHPESEDGTTEDEEDRPPARPPVKLGARQHPDVAINAISQALDAAKSPFLVTGSIPLGAEFSLLVPGDGVFHEIRFPVEVQEELEPLIAASEEATFGRGNEDVLDPSYRSALVLHSGDFAIAPMSAVDPYALGIITLIKETLFTEDQLRGQRIVAGLDKLNVYKDGDFFKGHVDTPKSKDMFGTLVINIPSEHVGGQLVIRAPESSASRREHTCDWGNETGIGWVAFFSDCEHEVLPVTSGHRVTVSYTLSLEGRVPDQEPQDFEGLAGARNIWRESLVEALKNPHVFDESRLRLCFYLEHRYPLEVNSAPASDILPMLKGKDSLLFHALKSAGLAVSIHHVLNGQEQYGHYEDEGEGGDGDATKRFLLPSSYRGGFKDLGYDDEDLSGLARNHGAQTAESLNMTEVTLDPVWQNPLHYMTYGNEAEGNTTYTAFALVATAPGVEIW